ncbi:MAG: hypothetical protein IKZ59_01870 [Clostridia bacterium]|nr:hypothetical protein [Clostridia bacterium]
MKHYIIVKFKSGFDYMSFLEDIKDIFAQTLEIEGVSGVDVKKSNSERENRYDLMIEMTMEKSALPLYDISEPHILWKKKYGEFIEKKAIFDCDSF